MKIDLPGSKEDLIKRPDGCEYCIFEDILLPEKRKIKVLDDPIPESHIHRITIEQICGRDYDEVCPMKYAAMRAMHDDFMAAQIGAIKIFLWDLGKRFNKNIGYEHGMMEWTKEQDLGRGRTESYAGRFRNIWDLGLRNSSNIFDARLIYELVVAKPETYQMEIELLRKLKQESKEREANTFFAYF